MFGARERAAQPDSDRGEHPVERNVPRSVNELPIGTSHRHGESTR